jgi:DNA-binding PadR family transcriptional regulator
MKDERDHPAPSWGRWMTPASGGARFFALGEVRLAILSLLEAGPRHGYALMKELAERSGGMYRASAGSVYPALRQLESVGAVSARTREGRKVYRLTELGRRQLAAESAAVKRIWERAQAWWSWGEAVPRMFGFGSALAEVAQATVRAAAWAQGDAGHQEEIRTVLAQAVRALDGLGGRVKG